MVNNSTNISPTNNYLLASFSAYRKDHDIWRWKSRSPFEMCIKKNKPSPLDNWIFNCNTYINKRSETNDDGRYNTTQKVKDCATWTPLKTKGGRRWIRIWSSSKRFLLHRIFPNYYLLLASNRKKTLFSSARVSWPSSFTSALSNRTTSLCGSEFAELTTHTNKNKWS